MSKEPVKVRRYISQKCTYYDPDKHVLHCICEVELDNGNQAEIYESYREELPRGLLAVQRRSFR